MKYAMFLTFWLLYFIGCLLFIVALMTPAQATEPERVHPICATNLVKYVATNPRMVAYICNMTGDIHITEWINKYLVVQTTEETDHEVE